MPRGQADEELHELRRQGLDGATADRYPELANLLSTAGLVGESDFGRAVETFLRALYRRYAVNPYARILLELFMLADETKGTTPRSAFAASVRRVRGHSTATEKDAFRKNEMEKAFRFAIEVLARGDVRWEIESSPALSTHAGSDSQVGYSPSQLASWLLEIAWRAKELIDLYDYSREEGVRLVPSGDKDMPAVAVLLIDKLISAIQAYAHFRDSLGYNPAYSSSWPGGALLADIFASFDLILSPALLLEPSKLQSGCTIAGIVRPPHGETELFHYLDDHVSLEAPQRPDLDYERLWRSLMQYRRGIIVQKESFVWRVYHLAHKLAALAASIDEAALTRHISEIAVADPEAELPLLWQAFSYHEEEEDEQQRPK